MSEPQIVPAAAADFAEIAALLGACGLPTAGLRDHLATALVCRDGAVLVASAALEVHGDVALLRSVAVAASHRERALGRRIARAALELASARGVEDVYLLTTTAAPFFARHLRFRPIDRADVPAPIRTSAEFTGACPETAEAMTVSLR